MDKQNGEATTMETKTKTLFKSHLLFNTLFEDEYT